METIYDKVGIANQWEECIFNECVRIIGYPTEGKKADSQLHRIQKKSNSIEFET